MNLLAAIGLIVFAILAGANFLAGARGYAGTLKFGSKWGLPAPATMGSAKAWIEGHKTAAPMLFISSVIALGHMIGCAVILLTHSGSDRSLLAEALVLSGAITTVALRALAFSMASKAAKKATDNI